MIPKGNQRAGGQQLATHLMNEFDNDRVEVAEVRGSVAKDLHGAFAEWDAIARGTQCTKYLYSMSINPDHRQGPFNRDHYYDFIARTEIKLGLMGQPRAVVFHVKYGREHCHVVWSRIDSRSLKAVQLSHDRQKLRAVTQEFARDHGITLPPGMQNNRFRDRFNDRAKVEDLAEKQQQERTGITKQEHRDALTQAWRESKDGQGHIHALEARGYYLARGDQRAYVVVDRFGEIHSLSRYIDGAKSKDIKARLAAYPLEGLPDVAAAQVFIRQQREKQAGPPQSQDRAAERRAALERAHAHRRAELDADRKAMTERHGQEREGLKMAQEAEVSAVAEQRLQKQPKGLLAFLARITGIRAITALRQKSQDRDRAQTHRQQQDALDRRHWREEREIKRRHKAFAAVEKRERRSLLTVLLRERNQSRTPDDSGLTPAQRARLAEFKNTAAAFTKLRARTRTAPADSLRRAFNEHAPGQARRGEKAVRPALKENEEIQIDEERASATSGMTKKSPDKLSPKFNEAAATEPEPSPDSLAAHGLSEKFNDKAEGIAPAKKQTTAGKKQTPPPREIPATESTGDPRLRDIRENAADITEKERKAIDLAKEFRKRAGQTGREKERDKEGLEPDDSGRDKHYRRPPPDFSIRR